MPFSISFESRHSSILYRIYFQTNVNVIWLVLQFCRLLYILLLLGVSIELKEKSNFWKTFSNFSDLLWEIETVTSRITNICKTVIRFLVFPYKNKTRHSTLLLDNATLSLEKYIEMAKKYIHVFSFRNCCHHTKRVKNMVDISLLLSEISEKTVTPSLNNICLTGV